MTHPVVSWPRRYMWSTREGRSDRLRDSPACLLAAHEDLSALRSPMPAADTGQQASRPFGGVPPGETYERSDAP